MAKQKTLLTRKKRGPAPTGKGELVGTRFQPPLLRGIDRAIAAEGDASSRPEMIRRIVVRWLSRRGHIDASDFQKTIRGKKAAAAKRAASEAIDLALRRSAEPQEVKERRKKKLTTIPTDLTSPNKV